MKPRLNDELRIAEQAAQWLLRLREDDGPACRTAFVAWLKHSPRHMEELLLTDFAYGRLEGLDSRRRMNVRQLLADAGADVVPLQEDTTSANPIPRRTRTGRNTWRWAAAAAGVLLLVSAVLVLQSPAFNDDRYSTAVGEQRSLQLPDGSVVHLNTHSRLEVNFTGRMRGLKLLEGEALFVVASDPARPFRVDTGTAVVQAVGTEFNVYRGREATTVAVIEGRVKISMRAEQSGTPLAAGEEAAITPERIVKRATPAGARTLAWRERQLVFSADPLSAVVEQVNRYNRTQLHIADPAIAARRLSGVFNVDDLDSLLAFLGRDGDVAFEYGQDGRRVTLRANNPAAP